MWWILGYYLFEDSGFKLNFGYLVGKKSILIDLVEGIFSLGDRNVKMHTNQENLMLHGLILQLSRSEG